MRRIQQRLRSRHFWLLLALAAPVAGTLLPQFGGLTSAQQSTLGVFIMAAVLWISGAVPLAVTGLMVLAALPATGALPARRSLALFGNPAVFFVLGAFILAAAVMRSGLSQRMALWILSLAGRSSRRLATAILVSCAALSCVIPAHAVAAIMFPTLLVVAQALDLRPRESRLGRLLFLSMAWGCASGGVMTLLGGARGPLALGILQETEHETISFLQWAVACGPVGLAMALASGIILQWSFPPEVEDITPATEVLRRQVEAQGPIGVRGKRTAAIVVLALLSWLFLSDTVGLAPLTLMLASLLFIVNAVTWQEVEETVSWGVLLMYGGAIALGAALRETGTSTWLAGWLFGWVPEAAFLPAIALVALVLTEVMSNAACVAVLLPIAVSAAAQHNYDHRLVVLLVASAAGLGFTLPVGSPANAIAFSSGYYRVGQVMGAGLLTSFIAWAILCIAAKYYWPLLSFMGGLS